MTRPLEKFQQLLRELFQFEDAAELDFGIYRIMKLRRERMEQWLTVDLPARAKEIIEGSSPSFDDDLAQRLEGLRTQLQAVQHDAIDADGNLVALETSDAGKEYAKLRGQQRRAPLRSTADIEILVYNNLYDFFSRYYDAGDFMAKRRWSFAPDGRDTYAVPWNGEEVVLHWANKDQYYIKTGERFTHYRWESLIGERTFKIEFQLTDAHLPANTNKDAKKKFYLPVLDRIIWDEVAATLTVPFHWRGLVPQDKIEARQEEKIRQNVNDATRERLLVHAAVTAVPHLVTALMAPKKDAAGNAVRDKDDNPVPLLRYHLNRWTRKNESDFFIHKDLRRFLAGEMDYFLKSVVLNLDNLLAAGELRAEPNFRLLEAVKKLGTEIIDFLTQLENFQKALFEKKKFIVETQYCITLDRIPESLYPEIAQNEHQIQEWKNLFSIDEIKGDLVAPGFSEPVTIDFLKHNDKLVLDTQFFDADFKDRLLAAMPDIDGDSNGLLIHSDNFQALNLLVACYENSAKCEYIDPPYNTNASSIPYKNNYKHSSWGTLMRDRVWLLKQLLRDDGALFVSIDKNERDILDHVLTEVFTGDNKVEELIWAQNTNDGTSPTYSTNHEYVEVYAKRIEAAEKDVPMFREPKPGYEEVMELIARINPNYPPIADVEAELGRLYEDHKQEYREAVEAEGLDWDEERRNDPWKGLFNYKFVEYRDKHGRFIPEAEGRSRRAELWVYRESDWTIMSSETKQSRTIYDPADKNYRFYRPKHPVTGKECNPSQRGWKGTQFIDPDHPERISFESLLNDHRIAFGPNEKKVPQQKRFLREVETNVAKSVFVDYSDGEKELSAMFGKSGLFLAPKHSRFVARFIQHAAAANTPIIDCFGGSGSTAHAVINMNREDKGKRKYVLVEVNSQFDTLIKPRVCKVAYSPAWRAGKPTTRVAGISHFIKYLRLESYEDALDNVEFDTAAAPSDELPIDFRRDYELRYALDWESRKCPTRLAMESLETPFDYKLTLRRESGTETVTPDVPETFAYLIGLHTRRRFWTKRDGHDYLIYTGILHLDGVETAVLWRSCRDWNEEEFQKEKDWWHEQGDTVAPGATRLYVNAACAIEGHLCLDLEFNKRMHPSYATV